MSYCHARVFPEESRRCQVAFRTTVPSHSPPPAIPIPFVLTSPYFSVYTGIPTHISLDVVPFRPMYASLVRLYYSLPGGGTNS